jgi:hypothetical protein
MQQPTVHMPGSALGDAVGISWLLRDVGGVMTVNHGGTTHGQHSAFTMVPERDFAFISMTNCGPNGPQLNKELQRWAFEAYLGVTEPEPEPLRLDDEALAGFLGHYETIAALVDIVPKDGFLEVQVAMRPEVAAELNEEGADVPEQPPILIGLLDGDGDRYVVAEGPAKGMRGYFVRDEAGTVKGIHMGGRLATKK